MVTLILSPEKESEFHSCILRGDRQRAREILLEAIEPTLDTLFEGQEQT
jgi:hypothetical protein